LQRKKKKKTGGGKNEERGEDLVNARGKRIHNLREESSQIAVTGGG